MKLLTHSQTSTAAPLKFGNGLIISSHNLMGVWLLIHAMMNVNLHESKWNLHESEMRRFVLVVTFISVWLTFQKVSLIKNQSHIKVFHHSFLLTVFQYEVVTKQARVTLRVFLPSQYLCIGFTITTFIGLWNTSWDGGGHDICKYEFYGH